MKIKIHRCAEKFMEKLSIDQRTRLLRAIYKLPNGDVKSLKGRLNEFRLRVGDWRVIFEYQENIIVVLEVGNRGDIY
jgi:mRNA interferase RelE/StbE